MFPDFNNIFLNIFLNSKKTKNVIKNNPYLKKKVKLKNKNNNKSKTEVKILFFKSLGIKYYQSFFLYSYIF